MKKIKFPLTMKDGVTVRDLEGLRENFDLKLLFEYYQNGKLLAWLEDRYYEEESRAVRELQPDDERVEPLMVTP